MSTVVSSRALERPHLIDLVLRAFVPLLWVALLGYQWAFASMVLDDVAQIVAQRFAFETRSEPAPLWGLLCDAYVSLNLFTWSLWFAACPRALTAVFSGEANKAWAQRRLARGVLLVALIGLFIQVIWLVAILRMHGADANMTDYVIRQMLVRFEAHLPWHWQLVALLPLTASIGALALYRASVRNPYHWIAVCWAGLVFVEMNVAFGLGQTRLLSDHSFGYEDRLSTVVRFAIIAVVAVGLLVEYGQVWQSKCVEFSIRHSRDSLAASPQPPVPSP